MAEAVVDGTDKGPAVPQQVPGRPNKPPAKDLPQHLTPRILLKEHTAKLTNFELSEVLEYPRIYYFGAGATKIKGIPWAPNNHGYDDPAGDLKFVRNDHLAYRFRVLDKLGKGSFGQVVRAYDYKLEQPVAIKIIRNKKRFNQQAMIEVRILDHILRADSDDSHNLVRMTEHFTFRNHLCLVFELLGSNMYDCVKRNGHKGFSMPIVHSFVKQLLQCLELLHRERIIHCDLKPENILLREPHSTRIKLIDFGSSCFTNEKVHTYIQSRFYRSPEVVLGMHYSTSIDIWSFGCVAVELITGHALFPADNEHDLILFIAQSLGLPPTSMIQTASRRKTFFDADGNLLKTIDARKVERTPGSRPLSSLLPDDPMLLDFVTACLCWEPAQRLTPQQALAHPLMQRTMDTIPSDLLVQLFGDSDKNQLHPDDIAAGSVAHMAAAVAASTMSSSVPRAPAPVDNGATMGASSLGSATDKEERPRPSARTEAVAAEPSVESLQSEAAAATGDEMV